MLVRFGAAARRCPGDEVVGFVTRGRGVTVHQKDCRVVFTSTRERRIDVDWDAERARCARSPREASPRATSPGLLAKITKTISAAGINIGAARIVHHTPDRTATQSFDLWVTDVRTLTP